MMKKVFSFNSELHKVTGVQRVLMDVHHAICDEYDAKIVGTIAFKNIHKDIPIKKNEYVRFVNPFMFRNSIVILHERKFLFFFWILNYVLFQKINLVYIHHNVFNNHRRLSIMPKTVVAISDEGINNLHNFFRVPMEHIHKIYNCVDDIHPQPHKTYVSGGIVKLLYPARVNGQKRQLEIVERLKGNLDDTIRIIFAGDGPNFEHLKESVKVDEHFECLGYRSDIYTLLQECDYMMLFSQQEGLPISIIESMMMGVPVICNNVGGNSEIIKNEKNGYIVGKDDWDRLIITLNNLRNINNSRYKVMSEYSRKIYLDSFSFEKFRNKYLSLLNKL